MTSTVQKDSAFGPLSVSPFVPCAPGRIPYILQASVCHSKFSFAKPNRVLLNERSDHAEMTMSLIASSRMVEVLSIMATLKKFVSYNHSDGSGLGNVTLNAFQMPLGA